ncbi:related to regulatory protein involved in control of sterol uptake [Phialocephala subalpina]|uniref:Related to regulatory protein involved in control of sterol uptake n=1 Tax=Phialocephala subalpina TaxID=576137 RepID=A0A1L7X1I8_9HELO|nr:related to regulatory protein involved in control of sterol uptake [Phialocephala subalpina]
MDATNARNGALNAMRKGHAVRIVFHGKQNAIIRGPASVGSLSIHSAADPQKIGPGTSASIAPFTRLRELELMHHWCTKTCHSFTVKLTDVFQSHAVKEALKHEYLADSLLALTSLHIASETSDPVVAASYVNTALQYQNNAVPTFRAALQNVTQSNCDAIFTSSILTMACSIVSPLLPAGDNDKAKSPTESILLLYDFVNGISSVVDISRQWLESGPYRVIFRSSSQREVEPLRESEALPAIIQLMNLNNTVTGIANSPLHQTYECAIGQLKKCFGEDKHSAVTWLAMAGEDFTNQLQKREPMALLIFMYWGVLLDKLDEMWWAKYSGRKIVEELSENLRGYGNEWEEATRWAKIQVGL